MPITRWRQLLVAACCLIAAGTPALAQTPPDIQGARAVAQSARQHGRVRIIARLAGATAGPLLSTATVRQRVGALGSVMRATGVLSVAPLGTLPLVVLEVDPTQLATLLRSGRVEAVQVDEAVPSALAQSIPLIEAPQAWAAGARGAGWAVAILDTGVQTTHPFLAGRTVAEACFSSTAAGSTSMCPNGLAAQIGTGAGVNCPIGIDGCTHGTHVAGIAAGRFYAGGPSLNGVAPDASIVAIQVFSQFTGATCTAWGLGSPCALSWTSDQIRALQQVATLAGSIRIAAANMSLVGTVHTSYCDDDLRKVGIDALKALGIPTIIAAGNDGSHTGIAAPACISTAVAVGATTDTGTEVLASFSDSALMVSLLAPGQSITSSVPNNGYATLAGTSMAAPHVAGSFAALRSRLPDATADQVEQALEATGKPIADPVNGITKPRIDVYKALLALGGTPGWHDWTSRGGSLLSFPECLLGGSTRIDCLARSTAGTVIWASAPDGSSWTGWSDLGGAPVGAPECVARGGLIDCFINTQLKHLAQISYNGSSWGPWSDRGGAIADRPSCVAVTAQTLDCLALGADRALYWFSFDGSSWKPAQKMTGSFATRPECVARAGGIDCFVLDTTAQLQARRLAAGKWSNWTKLATAVRLPPQCLVNGTAMDCFAQGTGLDLVKGYYTGTVWQKWKSLGGDANGQPFCDRLTAGFDCFYVDEFHGLRERLQSNGIWGAEQKLGGAVLLRPTCLARNGGARTDCFLRGVDGTMQELSYF